MKLHKILLLFGASAFLLVACGDDTNNTRDNVDDDDTEIVRDVEADTIEEKDEVKNTNLGKRSNPVPMNEKIQIPVTIYESIESFDNEEGIFEVAITGLISGDEAYQFIMNENQFNEEAPDGYQWIVLDVEGTLIEGSVDNAYTPIPIVSIVSESGEETPNLGVYAYIENEFGWNDLFDGGSTSGKIAILAPVDENYLIKWDEDFINTVFFDNK